MSTFAKKATSAVAALSIVFSIFAPIAGVSASMTSLEAANNLAGLGIIEDQSANPAAFRLGDTISRREALKVMIRASDLELDESCTGQFDDLPATDWGCKYAETALAAGLIAANPNFRPDANVSKIEALKMAFQARGIEREDNADWRKGYVKTAEDLGIISASFEDYDDAAPRGEYFIWTSNAIDATMADEDEDEDLDALLCAILGNCDDEDVVDPTDPTDPTDPIVVTGGDVMVSLNPASPAAQTVPNSGLVPFGKFDVTAGDSDTSILSITLTREGLSKRDDIQRVYFERNGVRVSSRSNVSIDEEVLLSFSPALVVQAGQTVTLDLVVELASGAQPSAEHRFAILSPDHIEATGAVQGTYPVRTATMRLGSYAIEPVEFTYIGSSPSTFNVGDTNVLLGEFKLDNAVSEKDVMAKTVTMRNDGTADVAASLSNLALYSDGQMVSSAVEINGRDVTFTLTTVIENGKSENFEIRADISGAERNPETYEFRVRNTTDVTVTEVATGFSAPIVLPVAPAATNFGTVTVEGGDILLSRDTSYTTTQTVSPNTSDVVLWAAKLNVAEAVEFEDVEVTINLGDNANMNQISSLRFIVENQTVASTTPSAATGNNHKIDLDSTFTVSSNSTVRLVANLRSNAEGNFNVTNVKLGSTDVRYVTNDEVAILNGSATGINTTVENSRLYITQNDGIDNYKIVSGAQDVTVLGFALRASDVSDVRVTGINPTVDGTVDMSNVSNIRLYQGSTLLSTRNNYDFNSLNVTIPKNTSVSFTIVADFNTSVADGQTHEVTVEGANIVARDVSSNTNITAENTAANEFTVVEAGTLVVTENSSTPLSTIVTPSTTEAAAFRFDVEALNDKARITDVYVTSSGAVNLAQALRSSSINIAGTTVSGVVLDENTLHFPLGSNGVLLDRDQKATAEVRVAFFDSTQRTNEAFEFALATGPVTGEVNGTLNGMRVLSESTGENIDRGSDTIAGNAHLLARSKPTVAAVDFTPSTNNLYRFSVTADANRKITLDGLEMSVGGGAATNLAGATITVRRDTVSGEVVFTSTDLGATFTAEGNRDIEAGQTVQFFVTISGGTPVKDDIREASITGLSYVDDVTSPASIQVSDFNVGIETETSSFTY